MGHFLVEQSSQLRRNLFHLSYLTGTVENSMGQSASRRLLYLV